MKLSVDKLQQWSTVAAVVALAAVAGWVSYIHVYDVVQLYGRQRGALAYAYPVTTDGLIYASSMVLLNAARKAAKAPRLAWWTLVLGILITSAANVGDGVRYGPVAAFIAFWPAVALVLGYELCMMLIRSAGRSEGVSQEFPDGWAMPGMIKADRSTPDGSVRPLARHEELGFPSFSARQGPSSLPPVPEEFLPGEPVPEEKAVLPGEPLRKPTCPRCDSALTEEMAEWGEVMACKACGWTETDGPTWSPQMGVPDWNETLSGKPEPEQDSPQPVQPIPPDTQRIPVRFGGLGDQVGGAVNGARKS